MTDLSLADLALHDATLVTVAFGWEAGTCLAEVRGPVHPGYGGARVRWVGVTAFEFARCDAWGPSVSVLETRRSPGGDDEVALQSGDVLRVRAREVQIELLGPAG